MDLEDVDSTMIAAVGYDAMTRCCQVRFKKGRTYTYHDVDQGEYDSVRSAESVGKAFREVLGAKRFTAA